MFVSTHTRGRLAAALITAIAAFALPAAPLATHVGLTVSKASAAVCGGSGNCS